MAQNFVSALDPSAEYNIQVPEEYAVTLGKETTRIPYGNRITLRSTLCAQPKYGWRYTIQSKMSDALQRLMDFYKPETSATNSVRFVLASNMLHEMCAGINPNLLFLMKCVPNKDNAFSSTDVSAVASALTLSESQVRDIFSSVRYSLERLTEILWNYQQTSKTQPRSMVAAGNSAMSAALVGTRRRRKQKTSLLTI